MLPELPRSEQGLPKNDPELFKDGSDYQICPDMCPEFAICLEDRAEDYNS